MKMHLKVITFTAVLVLNFVDCYVMETDIQSHHQPLYSPHIEGTLRTKRAAKTGLSSNEEIKCVNKHNDLRKKEGSSNMRFMKWNTILAEMAQTWADSCQYKHGQPANSKKPYSQLGQNLFITTGTADVEAAILAWYNEKSLYTYSTGACKGVCGHYTQVVWADTWEVGCGLKTCSSVVVNGKTWKNADYFVCNYGPPGNYGGQKPFLKGTDCTKCGNGKFSCFEGLCRDCQNDKVKCDCKAPSVCQNCARVDAAACSCSCADGWQGVDCSVKCKELSSSCPNFQLSYCTSDKYKTYMKKNCPIRCSYCKAATSSTPKCTSTVPPKVTTNPPGGTTVAKNTIPTTTISDPCSGWVCHNGGTAVASDEDCACQCTKEWQGKRCEANKNQVRHGIYLRARTSINKWSLIWNYVKPVIVDAINLFCRVNIGRCCPGKDRVNLKEKLLSYITDANVYVGDGYPVSRSDLSGVIEALIYVVPFPNNTLCAAATKARKRRDAISTDMIRRRRSLGESFIPQSVLYDSVKNVESNMTSLLQSCCGVELMAIEKGVIQEETTEKETGLSGPVIAGIIIGVLLLVILVTIASVVVIVFFKKNKTGVESQGITKGQTAAKYTE